MKKIILVFFGAFLILLGSAGIAYAANTQSFAFKRVQVTSDPLKQSEPVVCGATIFYRHWLSGTESNIWAKNILTKKEYPVIERVSEKMPVAASNEWLLYNEYISEDNWYDVFLYNRITGEDIAIATGSENQVAADLWGNYVIYNTGFTWPDLYLYNIQTKETKFIASEAIRPRIWGNTIVWIHSFGFGYATVWGYNLQTGETGQVPTSTDRNETWPDIYKNTVVWQGAGIYYKNLRTGEEVQIAAQGENPVIWGDFIAWVQGDETGPFNIYAYDIVTKQTLKISDDGATESSSRMPYINKNVVAWMSGATGQSDIYAALLYRK